jgi:creatinine amidohydrolase
MKGSKSRYGQLTWPETNEVVAQNRVAVLPVGSIEGHGPHLPLDTDTVIVEGICHKVAEAIPDRAIVLPAIPFGISANHMDFPGTLTISEDTFIRLVTDVCSCLAYHGFRRILIINGHGGNQSALDVAARRVNLRYPETLCAVMAYYLTPRAGQFEAELAKIQGLRGSMDHGGLGETSCYLALNPSPVDMSKVQAGAMPESAAFGFSAEDGAVVLMPYWSAVAPVGVMGDPRNASAEIADEYLPRVVEDIVEIIKQFQTIEPPSRIDHHTPSAKPPWGTVV